MCLVSTSFYDCVYQLNPICGFQPFSMFSSDFFVVLHHYCIVRVCSSTNRPCIDVQQSLPPFHENVTVSSKGLPAKSQARAEYEGGQRQQYWSGYGQYLVVSQCLICPTIFSATTGRCHVGALDVCLSLSHGQALVQGGSLVLPICRTPRPPDNKENQVLTQQLHGMCCTF